MKFYLDQRSERTGSMSGNDKVFAYTVRKVGRGASENAAEIRAT